MHYAPVFSNFFVHGTLHRREPVQARAVRTYHVSAGAWRNWWNMSVVDPESSGAPEARSVGARGRLPGV